MLFKNFSLSQSLQLQDFDSQYLTIWRKGPESKDEADQIYKINHLAHFHDEAEIIGNKIQPIENNFPILLKFSIQPVSIDSNLLEISLRYNSEQNGELTEHM